MKLLAYVRVSTAEQDSLAAQEGSVRRYCEAMGHEVVRVYWDKASGSRMEEREGLRLLLAHLESEDVDGVIVTKIDRLSRSMKDWSMLVEEYFQKTGMDKKLVALDMNIDTSTATGELFLNLMIMLSQWERRMIGERTSDALQQMRREGKIVGGRPPYGWKAGGKGRAYWVPKPSECLKIYAMRALRTERGWGARRIARWLNEHGLRYKLGKKWTYWQVWYVMDKCEKSMSVPQPEDFDLSELELRGKESPYLPSRLVNKYTLELFDAGLLDEYLTEDLTHKETIEDSMLVNDTHGEQQVGIVCGEDAPMIALWEYPRDQFKSWQRMSKDAGKHVNNYDEYLGMIRRIGFDHQEAGYRVVYVKIEVRQLLDELDRRGIDNCSGNRAAILSLVAARATGQSTLDDVELVAHGKNITLSRHLKKNPHKLST